MRILPRVECTRGAEKDLYPLTTSSYSWHLPQAANSKSAIENSQSSDNPKVGRLVFNSSGDQGWSKVQWGYWGTLSSLMWILTSFMQNELWVQLWTQLHSQPGYRREYLWMTLGFCLPTNLSSESWSTPGPIFQKVISSPCDLPRAPHVTDNHQLS